MADLPATRASLLVRLRDARDEGAWQEFIDLYVPVIYHYARKQGFQDADAVDLSQEVLQAVAGAVGRLEYDPTQGAFRGWLFTIVRRRLANWWRARKNRPLAEAAGEQRLLEEYPEPSPSEAEWEAEWQRQLFTWACDQVRRAVSATSWQAFWRTAVKGQPGKQVAADLGLSAAAVYLARRRIVTRLKELVRSAQEL
jgi:RNA polymerase sigma-70 factor (ECF subfamily)